MPVVIEREKRLFRQGKNHFDKSIDRPIDSSLFSFSGAAVRGENPEAMI
jgi:hypothetical protein